MRVLVVGEAPGPKGPGEFGPLSSPLYEKRLPGLTSMPRVNLLPHYPGPGHGKGSKLPRDLAKMSASRLWLETPMSVRMIFMGTRVSAAFGVHYRQVKPYEPFCQWFKFWGRRVAIVPHPSGVNTWYNDPMNAKTAEYFFRETSRSIGEER